jgi:hypothetical protein
MCSGSSQRSATPQFLAVQKSSGYFRLWVGDPDNNVLVAIQDDRIVGVGTVRRDSYIA